MAPNSSANVKPVTSPPLRPAESVRIETPAEGKAKTQTRGPKGSEAGRVAGSWQEIDGQPIDIAAAESDLGTAAAVEVRVVDPADVKGVSSVPLAIELARGDEKDDAAVVAVRVPTDALTAQFGADFAGRLSWVQVPVSGDKAKKADLKKAKPVAAAATEGAIVLTPVVSGEPTLLVAMAAASSTSGTGTYAATPLKSSSTWDVAEQTGAFTWAYEMALPPAGVGPQPALGLSYNSQSVDGQTGSTNNQPSAVGEGWELEGSAFIERRFVGCAVDDGSTGAVTTSGDLCWKTDNATISMAGHSGPLVKDTTSGRWRLANDDGTRFEHLQGTAQGCASNGTVNTDCWKMTTTDGTQYFFGLNRLPGWVTGKAETNSTWTVPVFGNDPGEPCKASTFAASSCMQAWRWNLDYVVDVSGNAQTRYYTAEPNKYAKNGTGATSYTRGGVLSRIEYGLRSNNLFNTTSAGFKVNFTYDGKGRCADASGTTCTTMSLTGTTKPTTPSAYPDVPWDQFCTATSCSSSQKAPTFFTNARLSKVQAQVLVAGAYSTTDTWTLSHSYPAPGDGGSAALWMTKVQHAGSKAGQTAINEPATEFSGTTMQNRVWVVDGLAPLTKWRLSSIKTTLGAVVSVNYAAADCTPSEASTLLASPQSNTRWCFPEWWSPDTTPPMPAKLDLFHKYPVTSVNVDARTGSALSKVTKSQYIYGTPKWRYNDSPLTPKNKRTWNQFAGVDTVEVREGDPATPTKQKVTKSWYYQGINGDRANASGGSKTGTVTGTSIPDERWFAGQLHRQQSLLGVGGAVLNDSISTPWASAVTSNDGTVQARMVRVGRTVVTEPVSAGGNRTLDTQTTYEGTYGLPTSESVIPSDADTKCTTTTYASANTTAWIIGLPSETRTVAKACADLGSAQFPEDLIRQQRTAYDGLAWGAAPTKGRPTATEAVDKYVSGQPHWAPVTTSTYDALGRPLAVTDQLGRTSTTAYTPAATLPLTSTVATNTAPFSWAITTTFEPTTGTQSSMTDPNGALTSMTVDALGRTAKVWLPLRPKSANPTSPSMAYEYTLSQTTPNAIKTTTYRAGNNVTQFELFDGLARSVQTQTSASGGGSVISTTAYDDQGRAYWVDNPYWTTSVTPSAGLFVPDSQNAIPSQVTTSYDAAGRITKSSTNGLGQFKFATTTAYLGGDRVDSVPPEGGTPTSTFTNSLGQKTKLVQHLSSEITTTGQATIYGYDHAGNLTSMTDPAGNDWGWTYDLRGFRTSTTDPDAGTSSATYDNAGNMLTTTDARGQTVASTFDELNRRTASYAGSASGAMLASWTYDTVKKGMVTTSSSYVGSVPGTPGDKYSNTVVSYDAAGNVTRSTVSIPSTAPAFGGTTYTTTAGYYADSSVSVRNVPAIGGLPAEQILYSYDGLGRLSSVRGNGGILNGTVYSPIGQLAQFNRLNLGAEAYSSYGYDSVTGALLTIKDNAVFDGSGHYVADRTYTRDDAGNITSASTSSVLPTPRTQKYCYEYDALRQLTAAWSPADPTPCATAPSAAALGGPAPLWLDYTYDVETGNRTSVTSHAADGTTKSATYSYPAAGSAQPHAVTSLAGDASLGAGAYDTDEAGNFTEMPGKTLTYNETGKLETVTMGTETQTQIYDASGNLLLRVSSSEGAALFLGDTVLTKKATGATVYGVRTYAGVKDVPVAERKANTDVTGSVVTWLFADVAGAVDTQTVASTGTTVQKFRDPFGNPLGGASGFWENGNGYLNKPGTESTSLTTLGARTYSPLLGKFLSVDPITDASNPQQNTGYAYGWNNPLSAPDPTGLAPKFVIPDKCSGNCGGGTRSSNSSKPPGYSQSMAAGSWARAQGEKLLAAIPARNPWTTGWGQLEADLRARADAYGYINTANFLQSEQGALVYGWASGAWKTKSKTFGPDSRITQGLRDGTLASVYRQKVNAALRSGGELPGPEWQSAGKLSLTNAVLYNDGFTLATYGSASDANRSALVIGSYSLDAVVAQRDGNVLVVQYTATNSTTLGSAVPLPGDDWRPLLDSLPGDTGPFSEVTQHFTWTETIRTW
ncbi:RHS repeat domain-containing protein [Microbacterium sulfonylureivorans]|uniref:RHS repeat domain-containing protein n=1 Tax=Microbacterium sulfonylureivorans TaxID=2486854 RepID=UPI0013DF10C3|nr:RHS repeat protein [Microbacterium sulfonylureivorans]